MTGVSMQSYSGTGHISLENTIYEVQQCQSYGIFSLLYMLLMLHMMIHSSSSNSNLFISSSSLFLSHQCVTICWFLISLIFFYLHFLLPPPSTSSSPRSAPPRWTRPPLCRWPSSESLLWRFSWCERQAPLHRERRESEKWDEKGGNEGIKME